MHKNRDAFTLIELLVVIAIVAIASVVVILVLNPTELLRQSRDANRVSDLRTIKAAVGIYMGQGGTYLGVVSTSYVSIADRVATSSAGDECQGIGLAALPGSWVYHCAASTTYKQMDSTGWIPIDFTSSPAKSPISVLPVDPINNSTTGQYFTYTQDGNGHFELTAALESQKYLSVASSDGGLFNGLLETGTSMSIAALDYSPNAVTPLVRGGYAYARSITVTPSLVSGTLSSFPLLFSGTYAYLAATSSGGNIRTTNGYDLIFTSDSDCSSLLDFELERYTSSTGAISSWIRIPTLTTATTFYLCYGNASTSASQQNVASVWDGNFKGVWHLPNGTSLTALDSTASDEDGTITTPAATPGQIGGGASFGGADYISVPIFASSFTDFTISTWINLTSHQNYAGIVYMRGATYLMGMNFYGATNDLGYTVNSDANTYSWDSGVAVPAGSWAYASISVGSTSTRAMVCSSGTCNSATNATAYALVSPANLTYFGQDTFGGTRFITGKLDEIRISNTNRTPAWINTEYNNQVDPSAFYTVGAAQ